MVRAAEASARAHAAAGGRVCGYMSASPVELIEAAGFQPLELVAGDVRATPLADRSMEDLFDPVVRGVYERLLRGDYDYLSAIVLPRAADQVHRLYYYLCELKRVGAAKLPVVLLADIVQTESAASERYSTGRIAHLWEQLRQAGNAHAGDAELRTAVARAGKRRELLQAFIAQRRVGGVSGGDALAAFAAARSWPLEEVETALKAPKDSTGGGPRIVVCGSPHDDDGLHQIIEAAGGRVVGDWHGAGEPTIGPALENGVAPLEAVRRKYQAGIVGQRSFGDAAGRLTDFVAEARADAVVFSFFPMEEALTWDYPEQKRALEAKGVAVLRLKDQARPFDGAADCDAIADLIEKLKRRSA